jgi:hypothetical protein
MVDKFDMLCHALILADEMDEDLQQKRRQESKFANLKLYLESSDENQIIMSFQRIEELIGSALCKSAYTYGAYWRPSPTHIMPNIIVEAGYDIIDVDLMGKKIILQKQDCV